MEPVTGKVLGCLLDLQHNLDTRKVVNILRNVKESKISSRNSNTIMPKLQSWWILIQGRTLSLTELNLILAYCNKYIIVEIKCMFYGIYKSSFET